ncbi:DUF4870 domain-containing protein [Fischerella thermalis]|uniref:DUF4870 domain-containing protein n=1 Tax=Fischerella thermalis TaxID=372787 RepID=UPI000C7F8BDD|nr:DUF4870 domain-containing protein [Fischerella thermalis]MBF2069007.1 DUF4870 domain-containing protein [Fischerella thermalis M48_A2018_028]PLZ94392.1 hypothetical protein CI593_00435 [Fischerella thermalis CCMEE 5194]
MYDMEKRKLLSAISHAAIFLSSTLVSIGIPTFILFATNDPVVKENAKEAINFHLNVWLYGAIIGMLIWLTFGLLIPLAGLWFLVHWGLTIWALFHVLSDTEKPFRYPFIFRIF